MATSWERSFVHGRLKGTWLVFLVAGLCVSSPALNRPRAASVQTATSSVAPPAQAFVNQLTASRQTSGLFSDPRSPSVTAPVSARRSRFDDCGRRATGPRLGRSVGKPSRRRAAAPSVMARRARTNLIANEEAEWRASRRGLVRRSSRHISNPRSRPLALTSAALALRKSVRMRGGHREHTARQPSRSDSKACRLVTRLREPWQ